MNTRTTLTALFALAIPLAGCAGDDVNPPGPDERPNIDPEEEEPVEPRDFDLQHDAAPQQARATADGIVVTDDVGLIATVEGRTIGEDGRVHSTPNARAEVDVNGTFSLNVMADQRLYLVQAFDASDQLQAQAILEDTGRAGGDVVITPIDRQSTVEAAIYLRAIGMAGDKTASSYGDLRGRIDSSLAAEVYEDWRTGDDPFQVYALAAAALTAQETELRSYQTYGADVDAWDVADKELDTSRQLSQTLYSWVASGASDSTSDIDAENIFLESLYQFGTYELALTGQETAIANANASLAFAAVVEALENERDDTTEATFIAMGDLQSWMSANAAVDTFAWATTNPDVRSEISADAASFVARADDAGDADLMQLAWADFYANVVAGDGAVLADYLTMSSAQRALYYSALDRSEAARSDYFDSIWTGVTDATRGGFDATGAPSGTGSADAAAVADAIVDARAAYSDDVWLAASTIPGFTATDTELMASLITSVHGAYFFGY